MELATHQDFQALVRGGPHYYGAFLPTALYLAKGRWLRALQPHCPAPPTPHRPLLKRSAFRPSSGVQKGTESGKITHAHCGRAIALLVRVCSLPIGRNSDKITLLHLPLSKRLMNAALGSVLNAPGAFLCASCSVLLAAAAAPDQLTHELF